MTQFTELGGVGLPALRLPQAPSAACRRGFPGDCQEAGAGELFCTSITWPLMSPVLSLDQGDTPRPMSDKAFPGASLFFFFLKYKLQ